MGLSKRLKHYHAMKKTINGIEQLYPLIDSDSRFDYRYGMVSIDDDKDYFFRLAFSGESPLRRLGVSPELVVLADGHEYNFPARPDPDMKKTCWLFRITGKEMGVLYEALHVDSVRITRRDKTLLDLSACEPDAWSAFFRAAWADCGEGHDDSLELEEFHILRLLAAVRHGTKVCLDNDKGCRERLSAIAMDPGLADTIIEMLFNPKQ